VRIAEQASTCRRRVVETKEIAWRARRASLPLPRDRPLVPCVMPANFLRAQARTRPTRAQPAREENIPRRRGRVRVTRASSARQEATLPAWDRRAAPCA